MPGFDGTGPRGQGAMTGGGRGYCAVELNSTLVRPMSGRGFYGRGGGRGYRNCFNATGLSGWIRAQRGMQVFGVFGRAVSKEEELETLKIQADLLKKQLDDTQARIQETENQKKPV
ncbi:MAG: DUF5320 domain-containing protein [Candidatus Omnitrophica bacterium]|nr:DUF5320 domain-containing protein [Candidatus Omnitrophota bacterium]